MIREFWIENKKAHGELTPEESRYILRNALYSPDIVGRNQPIKRPVYRVAIHLGDKSSIVVLDVYATKKNIEIVGWRKIDHKGLERMKKQSEREGGQFLILSSHSDSAAALSDVPLKTASPKGKGNETLPDKQGNGRKSSTPSKNNQRDMSAYHTVADMMADEAAVTSFLEKYCSGKTIDDVLNRFSVFNVFSSSWKETHYRKKFGGWEEVC